MPSKIVMLQIAFSVFSLFYILLAYYGYVRYLNLKMKSCESYAKDYLKIPRSPTKHKVIVSMTTRTNNFENIKPTVNSLLDQTVHPDQIIISTPPDIQLQLPDFIRKNNIILVHHLTNDYGKSSNFLSPLLREKDGEAMIILVDDSGIYGTDFVESMVAASEEAPNSVIFVSGYNAKKSAEQKRKINNHSEPNDVISTADGVLIKPKFFDESIFNVMDGPGDLENTPDVLLSSYLHKHNIPMYEMKYDENFRKFHHPLPNNDRNLTFYASLFPSFK